MWLRRFGGLLSRLVSPGYSYCYHCWTTWNWCEAHYTNYMPGRGCFPLCQHCWSKLSIGERMPYYWKLYAEWIKQSPDRTQLSPWEQIETAVLEGK